MEYYRADDGRSRRVAVAAVVIYALMMFLVLTYLGYTATHETAEGSILVDFGLSETGYGDSDTMLSDNQELPQSSAQSSESTLLTQEQESDIQVKTTTTVSSQTTQTPAVSQDRQETVQPREVNRRALFPGNTQASTSPSEGVTPGETANQGAITGRQSDNHSATGGDGSGISYTLQGRRPVTAFPKPSYDVDVSGKVIIAIAVNAAGEVISADFRAKGSTTQNATLVAAARKAAMSARFTANPGGDIQYGTIEYLFRLQ